MSEVEVERLAERLGRAQQRLRERSRSARHARMRSRVLARGWGPASRAPRGGRWVLAGGVLVAATLALWIGLRPDPMLVEQRPSAHNGQAQLLLAAGDDRPLTMSLSDGAVLTLEPQARVRVDAAVETVSLVVESGSVQLALPSPAAGRWTVVAGPYRLEVWGTELRVGWGPHTHALALEALRGEVRVHGPRLAASRSLRDGERLTLGDPEPSSASSSTPSILVAPPARIEPDGASDEPEPTGSARARSRRGGDDLPATSADPPPAPTWRALADQERWTEALTTAEAAGFGSLCRSLDAEALLYLADVARYAGRPRRAREALVTLRRRFRGTEAAASAAFDCGRLAADAGRCDDASQWFRIYLSELPDGRLADQARARLDECRPSASPEGPEATP